jgi:antitoxin component YwqK of YwqJK toxin-antitoxin module
LTTIWFENGQKQQEVNWKDGKEDGLATFWYETGQPNGKAIFKNGVLIKRL